MQREGPVPVIRGAVETLLASSASSGVVLFCSAMRPGQRVQFVAGPFAEQLGTLEQLGNAGRVRVLVEMMSGRIPVELERSDVIPVARSL